MKRGITVVEVAEVLVIIAVIAVMIALTLPAQVIQSREAMPPAKDHDGVIVPIYMEAGVTMRSTTFDNHEYIVTKGGGCLSVLHSPACPCHLKNKDD